jgi:hypothetical protein
MGAGKNVRHICCVSYGRYKAGNVPCGYNGRTSATLIEQQKVESRHFIDLNKQCKPVLLVFLWKINWLYKKVDFQSSSAAVTPFEFSEI